MLNQNKNRQFRFLFAILAIFVFGEMSGCNHGNAEVDEQTTEIHPPTVVSSQTTLARVKRAAERDLDTYLAKIPKDRLGEYGFQTLDELKAVEVGPPIPVYNALNSLFSAESPDQDTSLFVATATWRVPLEVTGEWRALATVAQQGGGYRIVDLGAAGLARSLDRERQSLPSNASAPFLLRIHKTRQDWLGYRTQEQEERFRRLEIAPPMDTVRRPPLSRTALVDQLKKSVGVSR